MAIIWILVFLCGSFAEQHFDECSRVRCPKVEECPSDSYRLPSSLHEESNDCCPIVEKCQCNPGLLCLKPECPTGWVENLILNATGQPGNCCPLLECSPSQLDEKKVCMYGGSEYESGETWTHLEDCTECTCSIDGVVTCQRVKCDLPAECRLARAPPNSCCPLCVGCVTSTGKVYNNSETWEEDACTLCECQEGRVKCHAAMCQTQCENPVRIPGECCPRCEHGEREGGSKLRLDGKESSEDDGYEEDEDDEDEDEDEMDEQKLRQLSCPRIDCDGRECPHGFLLNKKGCPTCKCNKCHSLTSECHLDCPWGYDLNPIGCPVCSCRRSRPKVKVVISQTDIGSGGSAPGFGSGSSSTSNSKRQGFKKGGGNTNSGEPSTRVLIDHEREMNSAHQNPSPSRHEELENRFLASAPSDLRLMWRNPEQQSGSQNGAGAGAGAGADGRRTTASPMSVSKTQFKSVHEFSPSRSSSSSELWGKNGELSLSSSSSSASSCKSTDDKHGIIERSEGDEWSDGCRQCVCKFGLEMCSLITCSPPDCEHPVFYPGDCCPRCPDEEAETLEKKVNITVCPSSASDPNPHVEGDQWNLTPCLICTCHKGLTLCSFPACSPAPCAAHLSVYDHKSCCPKCTTPAETETESSLINKSGSQSRNQNEEKMSGEVGAGREKSGKIILDDTMNGEEGRKTKPKKGSSTHGGSGSGSGSGGGGGGGVMNKNSNENWNAITNLSHSTFHTEFDGKRNCFSDDSHTEYFHGDTWKVGSCQSCICQNGKIECFSSSGNCPRLSCDRPVLAKNQCCPICLDSEENPKVRVMETEMNCTMSGSNDTWSHGHSWTLDKCTRCSCHAPLVQCTRIVCSISCKRPLHYDDDKCCPICPPDDHNEGDGEFNTVGGRSSSGSSSRNGAGGLEPYCAIVIAALLCTTSLLALYVIRSVYRRRRRRRLNDKSLANPPPDYCYFSNNNKKYECSTSIGGSSSSSSTENSITEKKLLCPTV